MASPKKGSRRGVALLRPVKMLGDELRVDRALKGKTLTQRTQRGGGRIESAGNRARRGRKFLSGIDCAESEDNEKSFTRVRSACQVVICVKKIRTIIYLIPLRHSATLFLCLNASQSTDGPCG